MGGATGVTNAGATCGMGGAEGTAWGAPKVMGAARGAVEVGEACDEGVAWGLVVEPPRVAVGPPASVRGQSNRLGSRSDCQPLFWGWSDRMSS
jgi:hypothetical protein